jgi:hypothetical protein
LLKDVTPVPGYWDINVFNCFICTCKGVALVPSVSVFLWCCSWIINIKMVATHKGVALVPSVSVCLCCCIWITNIKLVATDVQSLGLCRRLHLIFFLSLSFICSIVHMFICSCIKTIFLIFRLWIETVEVESNSWSLFGWCCIGNFWSFFKNCITFSVPYCTA